MEHWTYVRYCEKKKYPPRRKRNSSFRCRGVIKARGHQLVLNSTRSSRIPQYWKLRTYWLTLGRATNATPPKMWMPIVGQITELPSELHFYKFSPHAFHLDKKVEVFAAEGSPNHESPGQLKFSRFSAANHQFTLANQAYTTPHHRGGAEIPTFQFFCVLHVSRVLT